MLGKEQYLKTSVFVTGHDGMVFIKLHDDLNGEEEIHHSFALNFNAFNQIMTFWKIVNFKHLGRSIPLCHQKMAQTMKFDVFGVSFHPFNLVNNLKCFQDRFASVLFLTVQSVRIVLEKASHLEVGLYLHQALCDSTLGARTKEHVFVLYVKQSVYRAKKCENGTFLEC